MKITKIAWNAQEEEERDFVHMTDNEMCYEEARQTMPMSDPLPKDDKFYVVANIVHLCRATDATVGSYTKILESFTAYQEAKTWMDEKYPIDEYGNHGGDDMMSINIMQNGKYATGKPKVDTRPTRDIPESKLPF